VIISQWLNSGISIRGILVSSSNPLCDMLNIRYPIIQAGMAGQTTPELVAAVSNAGGLGILGATRMTPEKLLDAVKKIKAITTKPYGVNLWLGPPERNDQDVTAAQQFLDQKVRKPLGLHMKSVSDNIKKNADADELPPPPSKSEQLQIILEEKVPIASFAMGDPAKYIDQIHSGGAKVMSMVTSVEDAVNVVRNGSDIVMAQGAEAGGHRSTLNIISDKEDIPLIGTMALVPQIMDAVKKEVRDRPIPVVASGGIVDGRGLLAALALGASGVAIGTRFLVCRESGALQGYRERLLASNETNTVVTRVFTGHPARVLRNSFVEQYAKSGLEPLAFPLQRIAAEDIYSNAQTKDNADYYPLYSGQGLRMLKRGQSACDRSQRIPFIVI
jgi:nitronate monooxygenase